MIDITRFRRAIVGGRWSTFTECFTGVYVDPTSPNLARTYGDKNRENNCMRVKYYRLWIPFESIIVIIITSASVSSINILLQQLAGSLTAADVAVK